MGEYTGHADCNRYNTACELVPYMQKLPLTSAAAAKKLLFDIRCLY